PSSFIVLDALPRTAHGKLDIGALRDSDEAFSAPPKKHVPLEGKLEKALAMIWETLLGRSHISRYDNFFDLGGHSLLAIRLVNRIEEALDVRVPIRVLFDRPTIAAIVSFIDSAAKEHESA
ncbi:phosphopantetheine-binding protein, partial [Candidatus Bipolaricaulota bacterium]